MAPVFHFPPKFPPKNSSFLSPSTPKRNAIYFLLTEDNRMEIYFCAARGTLSAGLAPDALTLDVDMGAKGSALPELTLF
jgi:hypothetical protein